MDDAFVGGFLKNDRELVGAELGEHDGRVYGHLRIMVPPADPEGEWIRTRKGVALPADQIEDLREAVSKLRNVAASEKVVARLPAGREEVWVGVQPFQGNAYAYVRRFFKKGDDWRPTARGVSVRTEMLDDLYELVVKLAQACAAQAG